MINNIGFPPFWLKPASPSLSDFRWELGRQPTNATCPTMSRKRWHTGSLGKKLWPPLLSNPPS